MNNIILAIIELLGGMGAFLLGFKVLSESIEKLASAGLKRLFNKTSKNRCWDRCFSHCNYSKF